MAGAAPSTQTREERHTSLRSLATLRRRLDRARLVPCRPLLNAESPLGLSIDERADLLRDDLQELQAELSDKAEREAQAKLRSMAIAGTSDGGGGSSTTTTPTRDAAAPSSASSAIGRRSRDLQHALAALTATLGAREAATRSAADARSSWLRSLGWSRIVIKDNMPGALDRMPAAHQMTARSPLARSREPPFRPGSHGGYCAGF